MKKTNFKSWLKHYLGWFKNLAGFSSYQCMIYHQYNEGYSHPVVKAHPFDSLTNFVYLLVHFFSSEFPSIPYCPAYTSVWLPHCLSLPKLTNSSAPLSIFDPSYRSYNSQQHMIVIYCLIWVFLTVLKHFIKFQLFIIENHSDSLLTTKGILDYALGSLWSL